MHLRMLIGRAGGDGFAGDGIAVPVALCGAFDAIGPEEAGVEPLRRVRSGGLKRHHDAHLVEEGAGIVFAVKRAGFPAPVGPGPGKPVKDLPCRGFRPEARLFGKRLECFPVGNRSLQPDRDTVLRHFLQTGGNARLAEILLAQHIRGNLGKALRHFRYRLPRQNLAALCANFALVLAETNIAICRRSGFGEKSVDTHLAPANAFE